MKTLKQQIQQQKTAKKEQLKDLYYVDYCYHCKDPGIRTGENVTCHHPWYCHHDNGQAQTLEAEITRIKHRQHLRGYKCHYEYYELKRLEGIKWDLTHNRRTT